MNTYTINGVPYLLFNNRMLLVYASWSNMFHMLLDQEDPTPKKLFEEKFPFFVKGPELTDDTNKVFNSYVVCTKNINTDSHSPHIFFVSLSFQATIYKYLKWVFDYYSLDVSPAMLNMLAEKANNPELHPGVPEPLSILKYEWDLTQEHPQQYPSYLGLGKLFSIVQPTGMVKDKEVSKNMRAIHVLHKPPQPEAIQQLLIEPTKKFL